MDINSEQQRVVAYIDGFNLYYGLCEAGFRRFLWLNVQELARRLLRPDQLLLTTKYFTARISGARPTDSQSYAKLRNAKRSRQSQYLDALGTLTGLEIHYGHYLDKTVTCKQCQATWAHAEEKMTDVNIATAMLVDAFADRFDVALLVSGDSDLVPPIQAIKKQFHTKRVNIAFPPKRTSFHLRKFADGQCVIHRNALKRSQFPDLVQGADRSFSRPTEWQ